MPANTDPKRRDDDKGDIQVEWTVQGVKPVIKQFTVEWSCSEDRQLLRKHVDAGTHACTIPVQKCRAVYDLKVVPEYNQVWEVTA